ncbi:hypothetical protein B0H10DRAFT_1944903 [Mycena sp. CBHHK59/15]|nr:hypothetical protein B0H10DRAFT_1944903 [Mycena sp. CBHHK59/15]
MNATRIAARIGERGKAGVASDAHDGGARRYCRTLGGGRRGSNRCTYDGAVIVVCTQGTMPDPVRAWTLNYETAKPSRRKRDFWRWDARGRNEVKAEQGRVNMDASASPINTAGKRHVTGGVCADGVLHGLMRSPSLRGRLASHVRRRNERYAAMWGAKLGGVAVGRRASTKLLAKSNPEGGVKAASRTRRQCACEDMPQNGGVRSARGAPPLVVCKESVAAGRKQGDGPTMGTEGVED